MGNIQSNDDIYKEKRNCLKRIYAMNKSELNNFIDKYLEKNDYRSILIDTPKFNSLILFPFSLFKVSILTINCLKILISLQIFEVF